MAGVSHKICLCVAAWLHISRCACRHPLTGGLSMFAAAPVAALTGLEIAAIIAAASVGLALIIALFKDYEEVSYDAGKLVLKKRQS